MLTVVFYATNGPTAKARSREIAAVRGDYARVVDVAVWDGDIIRCDGVEVLPDVPKWQRQRIEQVYGEIKEVSQEPQNQIEALERKSMGLMPEKPELPNPALDEKRAVHKGGGRWFVMQGEERLSGPHDKVEAMKLAGS
jgi:hypothetical protein